MEVKKMVYKSMVERIADATKKGQFEGNMLAQGKQIRYFDADYFTTHSAVDMAKELNQEEWGYYKDKISAVQEREGKAYWDAKQKAVDDHLAFVADKKEKAVQTVLKKIAHLPAPIRPSEAKIRDDIKRLVGQPFAQDDKWVSVLEDYVGIVSTGEVPNTDKG
jgi:LPS O-antigen subunit length determinant protein (WzzB/FepE family)